MRAFVLAIALVASPAAAEVASPTAIYRPQPVPVVRYGAAIAVADAIILGSAALSAPALLDGHDSLGQALLYGGMIAYPLVGPGIHLAHRNASGAAGSFGVRVGLAVAGAFVFGAVASATAESCDGLTGEAVEECDFERFTRIALGGLIGMGVGGIGASAIDALQIARRYGGPARADWVVVPSIDPDRLAVHLATAF